MKKWIVVSDELKKQLEQSSESTPRRFVQKSSIPADKTGVHAFELDEEEAKALEEKDKQDKPK